MRPPSLALAALALACSCAHGPPAPATPASEDIALARTRKLQRRFEWLPWNAASFARARAEGRFILVDGAAEWCHWCHVMDETTYTDPEVGGLIAARFLAIRVDIDERPDFAERYADYGWPATILLGPDGAE